MAEDVAPRIRQEMESVITENNADRRKMTRLHVKAEKGQASFAGANEYAGLRGKSVRKAIEEIAGSDLPNGQMYYNIATRTVGDALEEMVGDVLDVAEAATKAANDAADIGLKPIRPDMQDNIDRLVDKCTEDLWDNVKEEVSAAAETLSRKSVDETVVQNARFQAESGLDPKITRTESSGACQWCAERVGTYEYASVRSDSDIFGRHANCDGVIEFHPGKGQPKQTVSSSSYRQNRDSLTPEERERRADEGLYRRKQNVGAFAGLQENMQLKHVRNIANDIESAEKDVRYIINRDKDLIGRGYFGYTDPNGRDVTLYPDAFTNRETLVKTIGHESIHVRQYRNNGPVKDIDDSAKREAEAFGKEDAVWSAYLERTHYDGK